MDEPPGSQNRGITQRFTAYFLGYSGSARHGDFNRTAGLAFVYRRIAQCGRCNTVNTPRHAKLSDCFFNEKHRYPTLCVHPSGLSFIP